MINLYHIIMEVYYDILMKNNENIIIIYDYFYYDEVIVIKLNIYQFYLIISLILKYYLNFIFHYFFN